MPTNSVSSPDAPPLGEANYDFHRLMRRDAKYAWWRPLAIGGTGLGFFLALSIVLGLVMIIAMLANPLTWVADDTSNMEEAINVEMNLANPADFSLAMVSIIVMIPAAMLAYLILGPKPWGMLLSVAGRIRWNWLALCAGVSAMIFALYFGLSLGLESSGLVESVPVPPSSIPENPLFMALLVILMVPFQSAAEEIVFRGLFMQAIGSWLKHPAFAILIPVPFFVAAHGYDLYGQLDVAIFAIAAGYLTWRTGGIEAGIAVHVMNNLGIFLLASFGIVDVNAEGSTLDGLIASAVVTLALTYVLLMLARRNGIQRSAGPIPPKAEAPRLLQPWPMAYPPAHPNQAYWAPPVNQVPPRNAMPMPPTEIQPGVQPPVPPFNGEPPVR